MNHQHYGICPNPHCPNHNPNVAGKTVWYRPHGWYACPSDPTKPIRRYRCQTCGRTFSETYFTRSWHLQRKDIDDVELLFEWCRGTNMSHLAKKFRCSTKAIENRLSRIQQMAEEKDVVFEKSQ